MKHFLTFFSIKFHIKYLCNMRKVSIFILLTILVSPIFSENLFLGSEGYYYYHFSDDFSEYTVSTIDDEIPSNKIPVQQLDKNGIKIWKMDNKNEYVMLSANNYFILLNYDKLFTFIKSYDEYWNKESEVVAFYEATSEKKSGSKRYDAYNLLYYSFDPWISDSISDENEKIIIESQKEFTSFRIVNGYVDLNNPKLFTDYSRVKEVKVYDRNQKLLGTYTIKNDSTIQSFKLPAKTDYIEIEISEIYDGEKFDDIAITVLQCYGK